MIEQTTRPLTEEEKQVLEGEQYRLQKKIRFQKWFFGGSGLVILAGGIYMWLAFYQDIGGQIIMLALGVLAFYMVFMGISYFQGIKANRALLRQITSAMGKDRAEVLHCSSSDVVKVASLAGEAEGFFFQVEKEEIYYLENRGLWEGEKFPNSDFEFARIVGEDNSLVLQELYPKGIKLKPLKVIGWKKKQALEKGGGWPKTGAILNGRLASIEEIVATTGD